MYLFMIVISVFLGSQILGFSTPVGQLTIYRVLVATLPFVIGYQTILKKNELIIISKNAATFSLYIYLLWWAVGVSSLLWVRNFNAAVQGLFLLSLGVSVIVGIYFLVTSFEQWLSLFNGVWWMMLLLVFWGLFEIVTGCYFFADLAKLDKYRTFFSSPWTRIPITHFANQNDYGVLLLAFVAMTPIQFQRARHFYYRLFCILVAVIASYLIYRTQSRMAILMLGVWFIVFVLLHFDVSTTVKRYRLLAIGIALLGIMAIVIKPSILIKIKHIMLSQFNGVLTGDGARINLWKNGLLFLAETFGIGVGAGNIEVWMATDAYYPTNRLVNIHNWWLEIFVGYGVIVGMAYVVQYFYLIGSLLKIRRSHFQFKRLIATSWIAFMIIFIFASVTSASNMLIEWHWVVMALIISFVKLVAQQWEEINL